MKKEIKRIEVTTNGYLVCYTDGTFWFYEKHGDWWK